MTGPWLLPQFVSPSDPNAANVIKLGQTLLWIGAAYQIFDGVNLGAGFCLRGAGDVRVPTLLVILVSWFGFIPLAHMLSFAPGAGWVHFLPQFGLGAVGGWSALAAVHARIGHSDAAALALRGVEADPAALARKDPRRRCTGCDSLSNSLDSRR